MSKPDFNKTSAQVERDILGLIDTVERSLDSSNGESERKGQLVFSAFVSLLVVFGSILGIDYLVKGKEVDTPKQDASAAPNSRLQSERDLKLMGMYLQRVDEQSQVIRQVKSRVAPAMPIDGQLDAISNAVTDMRGLVGIGPTEAVAGAGK